MAVKAVPDRCHTVTPYLMVKDGAEAIEFYKKAFRAEEISRMPGPDGKSVMHAELKIGDSMIFLAGEFPGMDVAWNMPGQWPTVTLHLYLEDAEAFFQHAAGSGCTVLQPLEDMFWGDRFGKLADPFGHHWSVAQHIEDVSPEELARRAEQAFAKMA